MGAAAAAGWSARPVLRCAQQTLLDKVARHLGNEERIAFVGRGQPAEMLLAASVVVVFAVAIEQGLKLGH